MIRVLVYNTLLSSTDGYEYHVSGEDVKR
jgi:hypothetical protein